MRQILLILIILFIGFQLQSISYAEGVSAMKRVVMIIAQENFRDEELLQPKKILEEAGITVKVASRAKGEATGMLGARVLPDMTLQDINVRDFDAIIFVGGQGASIYWDDPFAHSIANDANSAGKLVAAICIAPVTLAKAGLLKGKKATVWASEEGELTSEGARYTAKAVERDGNIITATGPAAAVEFAKKLVEALSE
jgi:protease I